MSTKAYATKDAGSPLAPFSIDRREPGPKDVVVEILYCGICHTDVHQTKNEWGQSTYPMVPGHEIVGRIARIGHNVTKFKVGDLAAVGCFVDSCRECESCVAGLENYCEKGNSLTYNSLEQDKKTPTYGGFSTHIVIDEDYTLHISSKLPLAGVAPLLCAGITTYSPLKQWNVGKGHKLGVLGLGGLGHMAVKFGASLGAEVTMLSGSASKEEDARRLGAHNFALTSDKEAMNKYDRYFDFIIDAVAGPHDVNYYLSLLKRDGTLIMLGVPPKSIEIAPFNIVGARRRIVGSMIGGLRETQEMLDYCEKHDITSEVEVIPIDKVNEAFERMVKGDVKYRFVIDLASLKA